MFDMHYQNAQEKVAQYQQNATRHQILKSSSQKQTSSHALSTQTIRRQLALSMRYLADKLEPKPILEPQTLREGF